jgi:hypothetical protein
MLSSGLCTKHLGHHSQHMMWIQREWQYDLLHLHSCLLILPIHIVKQNFGNFHLPPQINHLLYYNNLPHNLLQR